MFWTHTYNGDNKFKVKDGDDGYVGDLKILTYICWH